jgi:hypothetical protein
VAVSEPERIGPFTFGGHVDWRSLPRTPVRCEHDVLSAHICMRCVGKSVGQIAWSRVRVVTDKTWFLVF